jgi:hypothetical protein
LLKDYNYSVYYKGYKGGVGKARKWLVKYNIGTKNTSAVARGKINRKRNSWSRDSQNTLVLNVTEYIQKVSRPLNFITAVDKEIRWTDVTKTTQ